MRGNYKFLDIGGDAVFNKDGAHGKVPKQAPIFKTASLTGLLILMLSFLTMQNVLAQVTIGTGTSTQIYPLGNYYGYERSAALYTAAEITTTGNVTNIAWYANTASTQSRPLKIYLKTTTSSTLTSVTWATQISGATLVYDASRTITAGWNTIALSPLFNYTGGTNNLIVMVEANFGGTGFGAAAGSNVRYTTATSRHMFVRADNAAPTFAGTVNNLRPNIQITLAAAAACSGTPNAGTATISTTATCSGQAITLSSSGLSAGTGITTLWQSSPNGSTWTNISGATSGTYPTTATVGTTYYRISTTCSASSTTNYSNAVSYTGVSCGSVNMPVTGAGTAISCGSSTYLYDSGGPSGDYVNNSNGYVVFQNSGTGVITINGTLASELDYDYIGFYNGVGIGSTALFEYSGSGTIPTFTSAPGQTITVRFDSDSGVVGTGFAVAVMYSGTCAACGSSPSALTASSVTADSATLSWTAPSPAPTVGYQYAVTTSATPPASGTATTSTSILANALISNTDYYLHVRAVCSGPVYSPWATYQFTTLCNPTTTLPSTEGFEAGAPCWQSVKLTGTGEWQLYTTISGEVPTPHSGAQFAGIGWSSAIATDALIISPPYNISANGNTQSRVKVWIYRASNGLASNRVTLRVHTTPTAGGTMILDIPRNITQAPTVATTGWYEYIANVPVSFNANTFFITVQGTVGTNTSDYSLGVDDFRIEFNPPTVSSFTPGNICASGTDAERTVTITGTNFVGATAVSVNGTAVQSFTVNSATQITAIVSALSTSGTISVTGPGGAAASTGSLLIYSDYPFYADNDGDTFGTGSTVNVCSVNGTTAPTGYSLNNTDCNDNDNTTWQDDVLYTDADGDGYDAGNLGVVCYGAVLPTGTSLSTLGSDCDDNNPNTWQDDVLYTDADGDGYDAGSLGVVCYGAALPTGTSLSTLGSDCDDNIAAVNPGASETLYDGVDNNCNNQLDEGFQIKTKLLPESCGTTLASISSLIGITTVSSAITMYRIRVTNGAQVQVIERNVPHFTLPNLPSYQYATTYSVEIELQRNGVWLGYYGDACVVSSPAVLAEGGATQVSPSQCGITLPRINTLIATTSLAGVTGYRFKVTNITAGASGPNVVQTIDRQNHWFSLPMLTQYNYGSTYRVEVAVKTTGAYSGYGAPCEVSSPASPTLINCGGVVASSSTLVAATSTQGATQYRFQIIRVSDGATNTIDRNTNYFTFNMVPAYTPAAQYNVRVAVMTVGTWSPFGDVCQITSPGSAARFTPQEETPVAASFKATAYPNPFASVFAIDVTTSAASNLQINVYDMTGRLIETREASASNLNELQLGDRLPSGVYNVIVTQGENVETLRVIKR